MVISSNLENTNLVVNGNTSAWSGVKDNYFGFFWIIMYDYR